jgi:hypothetical protein
MENECRPPNDQVLDFREEQDGYFDCGVQHSMQGPHENELHCNLQLVFEYWQPSR